MGKKTQGGNRASYSYHNNGEELDRKRAIKATSLACLEGWVLELKSELLKEEYFNTPDPEEPSGKTAIHRAAENGYLWQVPSEFLTRENLIKKDSNGKSVVQLAAQHHLLSTIPDPFLERLDKDILLQEDDSGKTPLEYFLCEGASGLLPPSIIYNKEDTPEDVAEKTKRLKKLFKVIPTHNLEKINARAKSKLLTEVLQQRLLVETSKQEPPLTI